MVPKENLMAVFYPESPPTIGAFLAAPKAILLHCKHREPSYPRALTAFQSSPD
jgi:hypothetical protein